MNSANAKYVNYIMKNPPCKTIGLLIMAPISARMDSPMSEQTFTFLSELMIEVVVGIVFYLFGFLTSHLIHLASKKSFEKKFHDRAKVAISLIYESEKQFPGAKRGEEKLEYATRKFMEAYNTKDYETSQDFIIKMFSLTKLAK